MGPGFGSLGNQNISDVNRCNCAPQVVTIIISVGSIDELSALFPDDQFLFAFTACWHVPFDDTVAVDFSINISENPESFLQLKPPSSAPCSLPKLISSGVAEAGYFGVGAANYIHYMMINIFLCCNGRQLGQRAPPDSFELMTANTRS